MEKSFGITIYEKLKSKKRISKLFSSGKHVFVGSIHIVWQYNDSIQDVFLNYSQSVAKRNFKHAVKRNLLKRRIREAVRLNKFKLVQHLINCNRKIELMIIFNAKKELSFAIIEADLKSAIDKLLLKIN